MAASSDLFILDLLRGDGSRFVTAVASHRDIGKQSRENDAIVGEVSHWRLDSGKRGQTDAPETWRHPTDGWELQERYAL